MLSQHPPELIPFFASLIPKKAAIFVDVGCGYGSIGCLIRIHSLLLKSKVILIGIDINREYLRTIRYLNVYDHLIIATG